MEVLISGGQVVVPFPSKLPARGRGWLTVLPEKGPETKRRAVLPVIPASADAQVDPTPEQLD
jgi:hypothetical protein